MTGRYKLRGKGTPPPPVSVAIQVANYLSRIGVNTHFNWTGSVYDGATNRTNAKAALNAMSIHRCRDLLPETWQQGFYTDIANDGNVFDFICTTPAQNRTPAQVVTDAKAFLALSGMSAKIKTIEGPNEVNFAPMTYGGGSAASNQVSYQQDLWDAWNADATTTPIPVVAMSLATTSSTTWVPYGDQSSRSDYGNTHPYSNQGEQPHGSINGTEVVITWASSYSATKPLAVTETGFTTLSSTSANDWVDANTKARLILNNFLLLARRSDLAWLSFYELGDTGLGWGLYNADWTPTVAAQKLANLTAVMQVTGFPAIADPGYSVSGLGSDGYSALFQRNDGSKFIVFWVEPDIWNQSSDVAITPSSRTVTVTLDQAYQWRTYDVWTSSSIDTSGTSATVVLTMGSTPQIIGFA